MTQPAALALDVFARIIIPILFASTSAVSPAGETEITVDVPPADYSFGQHITFHLKAGASAPITEINLFIRVQGQSEIIAVPVPFESGSTVSIDFPYSMVGQDVPPFATLNYWWEVHDETGVKQRSEEALLYYADNRYDWRVARDEHQGVTWEVFWVQGDVVFGQTAFNVGTASLDEIRRELRASVPGVIRIFIYPSQEDLRSALNLAGYDWAGGQARPDLAAILVGVPEGPATLSEMERLIPHELTHLMVYEATGRSVGRVPPWLNEGLASLNERRPDPDRDVLVEQALAENQLFPLEALCAPFSTNPTAARVAYAQSASIVRFLREEYGSQIVRDLLAAYADSASCEAGASRVLGMNLKGLDSAWRAYLARERKQGEPNRDAGAWVGLWLLTAILALPLLGVLRSRRQQGLTAS